MNRMRFEWVVAFLAPLLLLAMNNASAQSPGDTIGWTMYDYQTSCSAGQRVVLDSTGGAHVVWLGGGFPGPLGTYYNYIDAQGNVLYPGGITISNGGYPQIAVNSLNQPGIAYHTADSIMYYTPSGEYRVAGSGYWPAVSIDRNDRVHVVYGTYEPPFLPLFIEYTRSNNGGPNWTTPALVDTTYNPSYTITSSPVSNKVVITYLHSIYSSSYWKNDVYYIQSRNGVIWPWLDGKINITNYGNGPLFAGADCDAVYDYNDNLHVIWNAQTVSDSGLGDIAYLYHYDVATGVISLITLSPPDWPDSGCEPGVWNRPVCKMSIGTSGDNVLFVTYTRFNPGDCSAGGYANGEIYAQYSSDGQVWSAPINLTNSPTPGCLAGDCNSDHWSSMAERIDDYLHVIYVNDKDAGGVPQTEGSVTNNPMLYLRYPLAQIGIGEPEIIPIEFETLTNYPNPFNARTRIEFTLDQGADVRLVVYDVKGALVTTLVNAHFEAGKHEATWSPGDISSGVYSYRLSTNEGSRTKRMVLLK